MGIKNAIRKILDAIVVTTPIWCLGTAFAITLGVAISDRNYYNTLDRRGKIDYLGYQLNTIYKGDKPTMVAGPWGGAAALALWGSHKRETERRLTELRANP